MAYDPIIYGGSKSSVKGYASSRSKYFDELEKERKKKEEDTIIFGDSEYSTAQSSRARTVEESKGLFSRALDVVKGVAYAGNDLTVGTLKTSKDLVDTGINSAGIARQQAKTRANQSQAEAVNKKYQDEENERVWKGYENAKSVDELPAERQREWERLQKGRKLELGWNDDQNKTGDRGKLNDLYKTQAKEAEELTESSKQMYRGAQYLPGVGTGVESVGTAAAKFAGDDSDINKRLIELTQGKNWDKLTDEEKKAALTQRDLGAALSLLDVIPVEAVATGVKTTAKSGLKAGLKAGTTAFAKSAANQSIKGLTKAGFKGLVKQAGKSTVAGAITGAGLGVAVNAAMGGDNWQDAATQGATSGAAGGFLGSPLDIDVKSSLKGVADNDVKAAIKTSGKNSLDAPDEVIDDIIKDIDATEAKRADDAAREASAKAQYEEIQANLAAGLNGDGSRFINIDETKKNIEDMKAGNYADDLYDITTTDGKAADPEFIRAATEKQVAALTAKKDEMAAQVDAIDSPEARELAMKNVNKLDDQIAAIASGDSKALMDIGDTGLGRTLNPEKVRERFGQLQDDLAESNFRQRQAQMEAEARTQPSRTYDSVSDDVDALGAGGVAPEAVTPRADFVDLDEVVRTTNLPAPLRSRARSLVRDMNLLEQQRASIMTPQKAEAALDEMDAVFNKNMARIETMPEPRRSAEIERVQNEHEQAYNAVQAQKNADARVAGELQRVEEQIQANLDEVMADANIIKDNYPTEFGKVDQDLNQKISQEIEQEAESAIFNKMSKSDGTPDSENINKVFAETDIEKLEQNADTPQVASLVSEALDDTFVNESYKELEGAVIQRNLNATYLGKTLSSPNVALRKLFGQTGTKLFGELLDAYQKTNNANLWAGKRLLEAKKLLGGSKELYSMAVDYLEGKDINIESLTPDQRKAFDVIEEVRDSATRLVRKAAYNEKKNSFSKRAATGKTKFTGDEFKILAERDGIKLKDAQAKYKKINNFNNKDVEYISTHVSNNATIDNYYPHVFDRNGAERPIFSSEYVKNDGDIPFGHLLRRKTDMENYNRDVVGVFADYYAGLSRKVFLEPSLQRLDDAKLVVKAADINAEPVVRWIDSLQGQIKYNKPDKFGESFNEMVDKAYALRNAQNPKIGENHYRKIMSTQRQVSSLAALGLSFRDAIQQTLQIGTAIGSLGTKDVTTGMVKYLSQRYNPVTSSAYKNTLESHSILNAGITRSAYSELSGDMLSTAIKTKGEKLSDMLMIMSQTVDEFARGSTYEASMLSNMRKGLSTEEAAIMAAADAARLNFLTSKVDMPVKLNGDTVRSLTQFMTFSYKQAEAWKELGLEAIKDPKTGKFQLQPQQAGRFLQMLVFYGLTFEALSTVAGINKEDNIPFYGNIFEDRGIPQSPLISMLFGQNEYTPGLIEIVGGIIKPEGETDFEKEDSRAEMFDKLTSRLLTGVVPAGSQIKKSYDGYQSTEKDGVVMKDGKVKYVQNTDDASKLKALTMGQYSTDAGREWVNREFPTLSEKQSAIVEKQKTKEAKERAYQFYAGLKGVKTKNSIVDKAKEVIESQPNKAARLISEHNAQVSKVIDEYIAKYGELSDYEKEYIAERYYINTKNKED